MANLFQPLQIGNVTLKNRIVVSSMCQYSSVDGYANDWHLVHLGSRAVGGAGLVFSEAAAVSPAGRISPYDLGIYKPEHVPFLQKITHFIKEQGSVAGIQLAHAGRKASHQRPWEGAASLSANEGAWATQAPSAIPYKEIEPVPHAMTEVEIKELIDQFRTAALLAIDAGFDIIELHGAHGYLLHEFLSPASNQRNDEYGGSFDNRIRLLVEVTKVIRQVWSRERPLFVRLSATDWVPGGWTPEETVALSVILKECGVDVIDCSSGGNVSGQQVPLGPLYQTHFAELIKKEAQIMTGAVGLITTAEEAESIVSTGKADLVFMARQLLRDPYFPLHAAQSLGANIEWPPQYERAR